MQKLSEIDYPIIIVLTETLKRLRFSFSLSGITRTGSMGLISACFIKAPLIIATKLH
jgi:hypothetical protein